MKKTIKLQPPSPKKGVTSAGSANNKLRKSTPKPAKVKRGSR
jgi:hypothetical protein